MLFQQINSEPEETKNDMLTSQNRVNYILPSNQKKRNALISGTSLQNFNDQLIGEGQNIPRKSVISLFLKNIYVKRFLKRLLLRKKIKLQFQKEIFCLVDDKSSDYEQIQSKSSNSFPSLINIDFFQRINTFCFTHIIGAIHRQIDRIPILQPESWIKIASDVLGTASRLYFLYYIPIDLAWPQHNFLFQNQKIVTIVMASVLIGEFLFNINVAYYKEGNLVQDRKQIVKHLMYRANGLELLSTLIIIVALVFSDISVPNENVPQKLILLLFLVHKFTIDKIVSVYETAINLSKRFSSYLTLVKLLMFFFYVVHLFACIWYWVGKYYESESDNWLIRANVVDVTWDHQYLVAFYYACVTMFTVGFGDITPKTEAEVVVTILFIILSSIQLPYSVNTVGNIIQQISAYGEEKKNKLRTINSYMQRKHVPYNLQNQIRQYLDYYWQLQAGQESEEEKQIIEQLPENLRDILMIKANHSFFNKVPFFKDNFSIAFKQQLLKLIKHQVVQPGQVVEINNSSDNQIHLLYVEEGELSVYIDHQMKVCIRQVSKQQTLGIHHFISGTLSVEKYKSVGITKLLLLSREDFFKTINQFPEDFETYCKVKDDIVYNQDAQLLESTCSACNLNSHKIINCPYIHYAPQRDFIIRKFNYQQLQKRKDFSRPKQKSKLYFEREDLKLFKQQMSIISNKFLPPTIITSKQLSLTPLKQVQTQPKIQRKEITESQPLRLVDYGDPPSNRDLQKKSDQKKTIQIKLNSNSFLKLAFVNAVKKVIAIQRWFGRNDMSMIDRFEISFDCKLIRELIVDLKRAKQVNQKDLDSIEMLLIKTKNLNKIERRNMEQFEQAREFKIYYSNYNQSKVLERLNFAKYQKYYIKKLQKLLPYLKYPGVFIKQYKVKMKHRKLKRSPDNFII